MNYPNWTHTILFATWYLPTYTCVSPCRILCYKTKPWDTASYYVITCHNYQGILTYPATCRPQLGPSIMSFYHCYLHCVHLRTVYHWSFEARKFHAKLHTQTFMNKVPLNPTYFLLNPYLNSTVLNFHIKSFADM